MSSTLRSPATRRTVATLLGMLAAAACRHTEPGPAPSEPTPEPPGVAQEPTPPSSDQGLKDAQAWLKFEIEQYGTLDAHFDGEPVDLTSPVAIDFEGGGGHVGNLILVRLFVEAGTTRCERLTYQADRRSRRRTPGGMASRAEVPTATVRPLLDAVRALSRVSVSERPRNGASGTTADFFSLVRVCGADGREDRTWEFAGYMSSAASFRYAAIDAVERKARETFDALAWTPVPVEDFRRTHLSDAFARNRDIYLERFHWWVMERSIEALGWFGDRSTLPTVAWIRDKSADLQDRQVAKLRHLMEEPSTYLEGEPREVPEK